MSDFYWKHGTEEWFLYSATPLVSTVLKNDPIAIYDYNVHLYVTTAKYKTTAYQIRAKLTLTAMRPNGATFGGVYEGTGTAWMGANGTYVE